MAEPDEHSREPELITAGWADSRGGGGGGPQPCPRGRGCQGRHLRGHTHPAQARHCQGDARLEVIRVLFAETGDEADGGCDHALQGQRSRRSGPWEEGRWGRECGGRQGTVEEPGVLGVGTEVSISVQARQAVGTGEPLGVRDGGWDFSEGVGGCWCWGPWTGPLGSQLGVVSRGKRFQNPSVSNKHGRDRTGVSGSWVRRGTEEGAPGNPGQGQVLGTRCQASPCAGR